MGPGGQGLRSGLGPPRDRPRRERLAALIAALRETEVGREHGLARLESLTDFRATVPMRGAVEHSEEVTARLGFGLEDFDPEQLSAARVERGLARRAWRERLGTERPRRVAVVHAQADDPLVDCIRLDDLRALVADVELLRVDTMPTEPDALVERLRAFEPDALAVPSLALCGWLEQSLRAPLERRLPTLRWLFVEHDLDERVRTRLPVINGGWIHAAGRIGVPALRPPSDGFVLATRSALIELLPAGDPEIDPRSRPAERTVLPEAAVLGERYELILSSALGFLRLRSGLHVRIVGFAHPPVGEAEDSLPRPRVVRIPPPPSDAALEGVTMAGAWLTASVRQAFLPEDPALVAAEIAADPDAIDVSGRTSRTGFDPFADTELGASRAGARRRGPRPRSLVVRLEVQGQVDPSFGLRIAARIDSDLRRRSAAYEWLRSRDELWEPRVMIARAGTARAGRERRIRALAGAVARPVVQLVS